MSDLQLTPGITVPGERRPEYSGSSTTATAPPPSPAPEQPEEPTARIPRIPLPPAPQEREVPEGEIPRGIPAGHLGSTATDRRNIRNLVSRSNDPDSDYERMMSAFYLSELTPYSADYVFRNMEEVSGEFFGNVYKRNLRDVFRVAYHNSNIDIEIGRLMSQAMYTDDPRSFLDQARRLESRKADESFSDYNIGRQVIEATGQFMPYIVEPMKEIAPIIGTAALISGLAASGAGAPAAIAAASQAARIARAGSSFVAISRVMAGLSFYQMMEATDEDGNQIDIGTARALSAGSGIIQGLLGTMQLDRLTGAPVLRNLWKQSVSSTLSNSVKSGRPASIAMGFLRRYGSTLAAGTAEEIAQESVAYWLHHAAADMTNRTYQANLELGNTREFLGVVAETAKRTAMGLSLISFPGSVRSTWGDYRTMRDASTMTKRVSDSIGSENMTQEMIAALESGDADAIQTAMEAASVPVTPADVEITTDASGKHTATVRGTKTGEFTVAIQDGVATLSADVIDGVFSTDQSTQRMAVASIERVISMTQEQSPGVKFQFDVTDKNSPLIQRALENQTKEGQILNKNIDILRSNVEAKRGDLEADMAEMAAIVDPEGATESDIALNEEGRQQVQEKIDIDTAEKMDLENRLAEFEQVHQLFSQRFFERRDNWSVTRDEFVAMSAQRDAANTATVNNPTKLAVREAFRKATPEFLSEYELDLIDIAIEFEASRNDMTYDQYIADRFGPEIAIGGDAVTEHLKGNKAAIRFMEDSRAVLLMSQQADFSSYIHELFHLSKRSLPNADKRILAEWAGQDDWTADVWSESAEENVVSGIFMRAQELNKYSGPLKRVLNHLRNFFSKMTELTREIPETNPEIIAIFDKMMGESKEGRSESPESVQRAVGDAQAPPRRSGIDVTSEQRQELNNILDADREQVRQAVENAKREAPERARQELAEREARKAAKRAEIERMASRRRGDTSQAVISGDKDSASQAVDVQSDAPAPVSSVEATLVNEAAPDIPPVEATVEPASTAIRPEVNPEWVNEVLAKSGDQKISDRIVYADDNVAVYIGQNRLGAPLYSMIDRESGRVFRDPMHKSLSDPKYIRAYQAVQTDIQVKHSQLLNRISEAGGVLGHNTISQNTVNMVKEWKNSFGVEVPILISNLSPFESGAMKQLISEGMENTLSHVVLSTERGKLWSGVMSKASVRGSDQAPVYTIFVDSGRSEAISTEILAHEFGHVLEDVMFSKESKSVQAAIKNDYKVWRDRVSQLPVGEYIQATRPMAFGESVLEKISPEDAQQTVTSREARYSASFSEYFADQTARWLTSDAKPMNAVERFFKKLSDSIKSLLEKALPSQMVEKSISDYLDSRYKLEDGTPDILFQPSEELFAQRLDETREAVQRYEAVPIDVLQEFKGEAWADAEIQYREAFESMRTELEPVYQMARESVSFDDFVGIMTIDPDFDFLTADLDTLSEIWHDATVTDVNHGNQLWVNTLTDADISSIAQAVEMGFVHSDLVMLNEWNNTKNKTDRVRRAVRTYLKNEGTRIRRDMAIKFAGVGVDTFGGETRVTADGTVDTPALRRLQRELMKTRVGEDMSEMKRIPLMTDAEIAQEIGVLRRDIGGDGITDRRLDSLIQEAESRLENAAQESSMHLENVRQHLTNIRATIQASETRRGDKQKGMAELTRLLVSLARDVRDPQSVQTALRAETRAVVEKYLQSDQARKDYANYRRSQERLREAREQTKQRKRVKKEMQTMVVRMRRAMNSQSVSWDIREIIQGLVGGIDPSFRTEKMKQRLDSLMGAINAGELGLGDLDSRTRNMLGTSDLSDFSFEQIQDLYNRVVELREVGVQRRAELNAQMLAIADRAITRMASDVKTTIAPAVQSPDSGARETKGLFTGTYYSTLNAPRLADIADGMQGFQGANHNFFVTQRLQAEARKATALNARRTWMISKINELGFNVDENSMGRIMSEYLSQEVGKIGDTRYTRDAVLEMYAGFKNAKKKAAIIQGNGRKRILSLEAVEGMTREAAMAQVEGEFQTLIDGLNDTDRQLADTIIEEYSLHYDRLEKTHGIYQNQSLGFEENYTPMRVLGEMGLKHEEQLAKEMLIRNGYRAAGIDKSFTIERIRNIPLEHRKSINLGLFEMWQDSSLAQEHYMAYSEWNYVANKMFSKATVGEGWRNAILEGRKDGEQLFKQLKELKDRTIAPQAFMANTPINKLMASIRRGTGIAYLAGNMVTVFKQVPSVAFYLSAVNPVEIFGATAAFMANPSKFLAEAKQRNSLLSQRGVERDFALLNDMMKDPDIAKWRKNVVRVGMSMIKVADSIAVSIGETAIYNRYVDSLGHNGAVDRAREITARTQPVSTPADMSKIFNIESLYLLTQFSNQLNQIYQMTFYDNASYANSGLHNKMLGNVMGLALSSYMIWALSNRQALPDTDDPKDFINLAFNQTLASAPIVGSYLSQAMQGYTSEPPVISALTAPAKAAREMRNLFDPDKELTEAQIRRGLNVLWEGGAVALGFPYVAPKRIVDGIEEYFTGDGSLVDSLATGLTGGTWTLRGEE